MKSKLALIINCLLLLTLFPLSSAAAIEKETVKIGIITPLTGGAANRGKDVAILADLYFKNLKR